MEGMAAPVAYVGRYDLLDALRGIAALGVASYQLGRCTSAPIWMPHGWLAADFFFLLSGFVLAHAYSERLPGLSPFQFMLLRARRLLPLSMLGVVAGALARVLRWWSDPPAAGSVTHLLGANGFNLILVPNPLPGGAAGQWLFPGNVVLWSLTFEILVNLLWATIMIRAGRLLLGGFVLSAALLLASIAQRHGSLDLGYDWQAAGGGFARALFGFFLGVLLWRLRPLMVPSRTMSWVAAVSLVAVLSLPATHWQVDLMMVLVALPAILWLSIGLEPRRQQPMFRRLGETSYPLYVIHMPIMGIVETWLRHHPGWRGSLWVDAVVPPIVLLAWLLCRCYERPIRRRLQRRHPVRPPPTAVAVAGD